MFRNCVLVLQRDMSRRDQRIDHLQNELHLQEGLTKTLKSQIKDLNDRFRVVDETGVRKFRCNVQVIKYQAIQLFFRLR